MIAYVLETIVCSALFLALYRLLVAGKVAPLPSRIFLVGTMILSAVIPALNLPILPAKAQYVQIPVTAATAESLSAAADNPASVSVWQVVVITIYITVSLIFLAMLCRDLIKIARLRRKGTISRKSGYTLVENDAVASPFTFWRTVFIGGGMELREREVVLAHESSHARHLHTVDKLLLSLLRAVYWFNPFYWMALSSLAQLQEWEADRDTLEGGVDLQTFRMTIFKQMFGYYPDLSSALIQGPVKKRFAMMVRGIKSRRPALRLGTALPLAALLVVMFGATACPSPKKTQEAEPIQKNVSAVFVDSVGTCHKIEVDIKEVKQNDTLAGYEVNGRFIPKDSTLKIVPKAVLDGDDVISELEGYLPSLSESGNEDDISLAGIVDLSGIDESEIRHKMELKKRTRSIQSVYRSKKAEIEAIDTRIEGIDTRIESLKLKYERAKDNRFTKQTELDGMRQVIKSREKEVVDLDKSVNAIRKEIEELGAGLKRKEAEFEDWIFTVKNEMAEHEQQIGEDAQDKKTGPVSVNPNMKRDTINDAVIVVRGDDSDTKYTVNGVVVPKDSLIRIDKSKIESVSVNKEKNTILIILKD